VRGWGVAVVVACAIGASNAGADGGVVMRVGAREPLAMVFLAPEAERAKVTFTALQDALVHALDADTKMRLEPADAEIRTCEGRLACIVERARGASAGAPPTLLLIVSVRATPGQPDLVSSILVDGTQAQEVTRKARLAGADADAIEEQIAAEVLLRAPLATVADAAGLESLAQALVASFQPAFAARGLWKAFGRVVLTVEPGVPVELDGQLLGLSGETTTLVDIPPGPHRITVTRPDGPTLRQVAVTAGSSFVISAAPDEVAMSGTRKIQWAGGVVAAVGVATLVAGIIGRSETRPMTCNPAGEAKFVCRQDAFERLTEGSGPLVIPLGYSTASAGAAMAFGPMLVSEETLDSPWWIAVAASVLVSGYVISEAAN